MIFEFFRPPKSVESPLPRRAIRLEAIGGQGANSAGKILAEAAVLGMGFQGNHYASFGSEKRGTPVSSFVRFTTDGSAVRTASSVRHPNVLAVFHELLLATQVGLLDGAGSSTTLVLNSREPPRRVQVPQGSRLGRVIGIDASGIAQRKGCGLNCVMLGALSHALPEIEPAKLAEALDRFFARLPAAARRANRAGFEAGRREAAEAPFSELQATLPAPRHALPRLGYLNAPLGGLIGNGGNSVLKDNSASRKGTAPKLLRDVCYSCGRCDLVCPDFCFVWERNVEGKAELRGIDYQFCKGCRKCVEACPVEALVSMPEDEIGADERKWRRFPEASAASVEQRWRSADWSKLVEEMSPEARMLTPATKLEDPGSALHASLDEKEKE